MVDDSGLTGIGLAGYILASLAGGAMAGLIALSFFLVERVGGAGCRALPELPGREDDRRVGLGASILILIFWGRL